MLTHTHTITHTHTHTCYNDKGILKYTHNTRQKQSNWSSWLLCKTKGHAKKKERKKKRKKKVRKRPKPIPTKDFQGVERCRRKQSAWQWEPAGCTLRTRAQKAINTDSMGGGTHPWQNKEPLLLPIFSQAGTDEGRDVSCFYFHVVGIKPFLCCVRTLSRRYDGRVADYWLSPSMLEWFQIVQWITFCQTVPCQFAL